jgi:hypothetical protein
MDVGGGAVVEFLRTSRDNTQRRPKVDVEWEDLQAAFLSTRTDREYFLDRESGEVVSLSESEDEDLEEEEEEEAEEGEEEGDQEEEDLRAEFENDPDRFVEISPIPLGDLVEWMNGFIITVKSKDFAKSLAGAVNGHHPDRDFDRVLRKVPAERGRWLGFLESQVQEIIDGWIEENDIESETPPPWKPKTVRRRSSKKSPEAD